MPRVHRLVDGDAPTSFTDGSFYRNRFYFLIFENPSSFKNRTFVLLPSPTETLVPFSLTLLLLFLIFKRFLKPSSFDSRSFSFVSRPKVFEVPEVPFLLLHRLC